MFDVEEDPDNANVLYLGTDYGIFVTVDQGKTLDGVLDVGAQHVTIRDVAIQKRDREMAIGTYGRGFYVADIGPIKEFKPEVFQEPAHLFDIKNDDQVEPLRAARRHAGRDGQGRQPAGRREHLLLPEGGRAEREGDDQGPGGHHDPGADAEQQEGPAEGVLGPEPAGGRAARRRGRGGRAGRRPAGAAAPAAGAVNNPDQPPQARGRRARPRRARAQVDPGVYKVTLTVDGKDVETKKMTVSPDPLFK